MAELILITGLPGHGKSLYAVHALRKQLFSKEPVYYLQKESVSDFGAGVSGISKDLGWTGFLNAHDWYLLPDRSTIWIDEAQYCFPQRGGKEQIPEWVAPFAEFRKKGYTIVLCSQNAMDLDIFIRRRVTRHIHVRRLLGWQRTQLITYPEYQANPMDRWSLKKAVSRSMFKFSRADWECYESALVHEPGRFGVLGKVLVVGGLLAAVLVWSLYGLLDRFYLQHRSEQKETVMEIQNEPVEVKDEKKEGREQKHGEGPEWRMVGYANLGGKEIWFVEVEERVYRLSRNHCYKVGGEPVCDVQAWWKATRKQSKAVVRSSSRATLPLAER